MGGTENATFSHLHPRWQLLLEKTRVWHRLTRSLSPAATAALAQAGRVVRPTECCRLGPNGVRFPVMQGKYREFFHFRATIESSANQKRWIPKSFWGQFPAQENREFCSPNREPFSSQQGNFNS